MRPPQATRISSVRSCVACRTRRPKGELIRVALTPDGAVVAEGQRARAPGRGAYVCNVSACVHEAVETGALSRALSRALSTELDRPKLRAELERLIDVDEEND
ncbi:MAG TPA: YlxR family protein [Actinomycetota bacterium]|nr:YlxR family protein [Actinomycetota bacterium]